jgi:hypothetical protein
MAGPPTIELPGAFTSDVRTGSTPPGGVSRTNVQHALAAADSRRGFPHFSTPVWIAIAACWF